MLVPLAPRLWPCASRRCACSKLSSSRPGSYPEWMLDFTWLDRDNPNLLL